MAENIEKSEDALTYTITLSEKAKFQDGIDLTSDDIIFTIEKIQDKNINSPIRINFEGVSIEKINNKTIIFHLKNHIYILKKI